MYKDMDQEFEFETELLRRGAYVSKPATNPEAAPIYLTTAFNVENLDELQARYDAGGFCYNRNRNPNRSNMIELMNYVEQGEDSIICSSGMAAISTVIMSLVSQGDHIVSDQTLYGETLDIFRDVLPKYGVDTTVVDFTDLAQVEAAVKAETKVLFTETVSNPMITVVDIEAVAKIAHDHDAVLVVDNTFITPVGYKPLLHGADISINSLTKFANGHSDAVCGAATGRADLIKKAYSLQVLLGTSADAYTSWMVQRGMRTMDLRLEKQMSNANKLAHALEANPHIKKVHYPGLEKHPQHALAKDMFGDVYGGMMTIELDDDSVKLNAFMKKLTLAHYAMTLGGYRTTLSHPVMSSHYDVPEEERVKMGITYGMLRISVGIENPDDLIQDFLQALSVYDD